MEITRSASGFIQTMVHPTVRALVCDCICGQCTVQYTDGREHTVSIGCTVFHAQYGIPVSDDGAVLFVTDWESGLRAVAVPGGQTLWFYAQRGLARLLLCGDRIIAHRQGRALIALDARSGAVQSTLPCANIDHIIALTKRYALAANTGGRVCLIDLDAMAVVRRYARREINPNGCLSVLIQSAALLAGCLVLSGVERYPNGDTADRTDRAFCRKIEPWL